MTYPVPRFRKKSPGEAGADRHFREIELSRATGEFSDGRAYLLEDWLDADNSVYVRTVFYSVEGIEDWTADRHLAFAERHDLLVGRAEAHVHSLPATKVVRDEDNQDMWSATFVMKSHDRF